jgi:hypothetical protein
MDETTGFSCRSIILWALVAVITAGVIGGLQAYSENQKSKQDLCNVVTTNALASDDCQ